MYTPQFAVFAVLNTIVSANHPPPMPPLEAMPRHLHDLLLLCFERDTSLRPTTAELQSHPWILQSGGTQIAPA